MCVVDSVERQVVLLDVSVVGGAVNHLNPSATHKYNHLTCEYNPKVPWVTTCPDAPKPRPFQWAGETTDLFLLAKNSKTKRYQSRERKHRKHDCRQDDQVRKSQQRCGVRNKTCTGDNMLRTWNSGAEFMCRTMLFFWNMHAECRDRTQNHGQANSTKKIHWCLGSQRMSDNDLCAAAKCSIAHGRVCSCVGAVLCSSLHAYLPASKAKE